MSSWKAAVRASFLVLLAACTGDSGSPLAPEAGGPALEVSDAAHAGTVPGFYFLPPMVSQPTYGGTFDPAVPARVEICEFSGSSCGPVIATYTTTTGHGGEVVRVDPAGEKYSVSWHTDLFNLDVGKHYRISVYVGSFRLGFADVDPVSTGKELKVVDTNQFIPLVDGRTLPIKFRVETGIVASVAVSPAAATTSVGGTQQFTATLSDLHGNPIVAPVSWASSSPAVATIDAGGLAAGVAEGTATITAASGGASGAASLTVLNPNTAPVAVDDAFDAIGNVSVPVAAPGVLAGDTDAENNALSVAAPGTYATASGGTVTLNADGSFTYLSAAGFTGTDQFSYAASDGSLTSNTATVTITVGSRVWYVRNNGTPPGDGRDASPFTTLKAVEAASGAGETIFLLAGDGTTTGYDEGIVLKAGQALTGQGVSSSITATLNGQSVVLLGAGATPQVTRSTAGATVQLGSNNTVQGVAVASTAGAGIAGNGFGTLTAGSLSVAAVGGPALDLQSGSASAAFTSLSSASSGGAGVLLSGVVGTLSSGGGTVSGAAASGVSVSSTAGSLSLALSAMALQSNSGSGILLSAQGSSAMSLTVQGSQLLGNSAFGIRAHTAASGSANVSVSGSTFQGNNVGVDLGHGSSAAFAFSVLDNGFTGHAASPVNVNRLAVPALVPGLFSGTVAGNVIGTAGVAGSGSTSGSGIRIVSNGSTDGTTTIVVEDNVIRSVNGRGVDVLARDGNSAINATIRDNDIQLGSAFALEAIRVDAGALSTDQVSICAAISGNTAQTSGLQGIRLRQRFTGTTFRLAGYAGSATDASAVAAFLASTNTASGASVATAADFGGTGYQGIAACPTP